MLCALVALAGLAAPGAAHARQDAMDATDIRMDEALEGRLVRDVRLEGVSAANRPLAENQLRTEAGRPLRIETVSDDIRNLYRLGRFRSISATANLFDDGAVEVVFIFEEAPIIRDVQVTGNQRIKTKELSAVVRSIGLQAGVPIDDFRVGKARRAIEDLYRAKGYYTVEVFVDETELRDTGVVLLRVREGERVRVTGIRFEGVHKVKEQRVRNQVKTEVKSIIHKGPLDEDLLEQDVASIVQFYRDEGFLDVRADRRVTISPNGREAIITFVIEEGPIYTLRNVVVRNADGGDIPLAFGHDQIVALLDIKRGDVYGARTVLRSRAAVQDAFWRLGYAEVSVNVQELRDTREPLVDLLMVVSQGRRFMTGEIIVEGNTITRQSVIREQIKVLPDMPLDRVAIEDSRRRLIGTRLFAAPPTGQPPKITIQPERPDEPGYRDLLVEVEETNTGSFTFGFAVNSDAGLVGAFSLAQSNFDISDTPETVGELFSGRAFRGGGQTLNLSISPGTQVQTYALAWSDPTFNDSDTSIGASISFRDRIYSQYDEQRYGGNLSLGRRVGDRWNASVFFNPQWVELFDIDENAPVDVYEAAPLALVAGVGARVSRTTIPPGEAISPSRGLRTTLSIEQIFGDYDFTKLGASQDIFFTIAEDAVGRRSKISLDINASYIPQSGEAPTYERYYMGGRSFRGFDFRTISPKGIRNDTGTQGNDPVGGQWLFFAGAQYEFPLFGEVNLAPGIVDPLLAGVVFTDTGTVLADFGFEEYRVSVGFGLRIRIPALGPNPLAFDFGFPILKQERDDERLFSFSLDVPF